MLYQDFQTLHSHDLSPCLATILQSDYSLLPHFCEGLVEAGSPVHQRREASGLHARTTPQLKQSVHTTTPPNLNYSSNAQQSGPLTQQSFQFCLLQCCSLRGRNLFLPSVLERRVACLLERMEPLEIMKIEWVGEASCSGLTCEGVTRLAAIGQVVLFQALQGGFVYKMARW